MRNREKIYLVPNQDCTVAVLGGPKFLYLSRYVGLWIVMIKNDHTIIHRSKLLSCHSRHVTGNAEEGGNQLCQRASFANNCCWIWPVLEDLHNRLLVYFELIRMDRYLCRYYTIVSILSCTNWHGPSFERLPDYAGPTSNKYFIRSKDHAISYWHLSYIMPKDALIPGYVTWQSWWYNIRLRTTFREFLLERTSTMIEFFIPMFRSIVGWCFIAI